MNAAKKIILLLWLILAASLGNASALTPGATGNRVWQKSFETLETRQAEPLQTLGGHQENEGAGYDYAVDSLLAADTAPSFFDGASYTPKVLNQMQGGVGEFHSFPESVTAFESSGTVQTITGGDGVVRQVLEIPGSYGSGGNGVFQFIKNADGTINHRLFVPNPP